MKYNMLSCGGCRSCELACSFHHTGKFEPSVSSLIVIDKKDLRGFKIEFTDSNKDGRFECDGCKDLDEPACIEWCKQKEDLKKYLANFLKRKNDKK